MTCPQCGAENADNAWNCVSCRINLYWASQHYDELARTREQKGLDPQAQTPAFLVRVSQHELAERARRGLKTDSKVRTIARKVMNGESSEEP
jgi:hypothetical protein